MDRRSKIQGSHDNGHASPNRIGVPKSSYLEGDKAGMLFHVALCCFCVLPFQCCANISKNIRVATSNIVQQCNDHCIPGICIPDMFTRFTVCRHGGRTAVLEKSAGRRARKWDNSTRGRKPFPSALTISRRAQNTQKIKVNGSVMTRLCFTFLKIRAT